MQPGEHANAREELWDIRRQRNRTCDSFVHMYSYLKQRGNEGATVPFVHKKEIDNILEYAQTDESPMVQPNFTLDTTATNSTPFP